MKIFYSFSLAVSIIAVQLFCLPAHVTGQDRIFKVWVKTSPCSGRNDWISVARENPTGGQNFFYLADQVFPGTACTSSPCSFAEATAIANTLRNSNEFSKYCCRDYSVWKNTQTGKMTVVLGKFGTAGFGWQIVKADLCCEEAEALAGIPGSCSGTTDNNQNPPNINCPPGSRAKWNADTRKTECYCDPGLFWNSTRTACVKPEVLVAEADCSKYPGSYAAFNHQTQKVECWCPEGKKWNSTMTACIDDPGKVNCWPGSYAAINPQTQKTECYCNPGLVWNSTKTACVDPKVLVSEADCSKYPGSYAAWNTQTQKVECWCPEGKKWNATLTACIDDPAKVNCWPGSYAAINPQTQKTECYCNPGLVWNSTKTACVDPQELVRSTDCSKFYPGSYAAWNSQTQKVECNCPTGYQWNATRTACVPSATDCNSYYPNSEAKWNPQANKYECYCKTGYEWNSTRTACVPTAIDCNSYYPNSEAKWNPQANKYECYCKTGYEWNSTRTACIATAKDCNSYYPNSEPKWNAQTNQYDCQCKAGYEWNSSRNACVPITTNKTDGGGTGTWTLVSTTVNPPDPDKVWLDKSWTYSAQSTSAALRAYNGDKLDFQWTAPPQQITGNGFTISLSAKVTATPNNRQVGALTGVEGSGLTSDTPADQQRAYAYSGDIIGATASAQKSVTFKPVPNASEIVVRIGIQYSVTFTYKYKKVQ